jgi:predicted  nucleic acid-binding Zn-ribbon protein
VDVDFNQLIALQRLDIKLKHLSAFLDTIPARVAAIDAKIEKSSQDLSLAKDRLAQNLKRRREFEGEVKDFKAHISKYKVQLNEVKTNKEYTALLHEIDQAKAKVDGLEEEIISEMLAADDIERDIRAASETCRQAEEVFQKEKDALLARKASLEARRDRIRAEREAQAGTVPPETLDLYQAIFAKRTGLVLSRVKGDFCSLCHMRIRPQVLEELMAGSSLILCEACGRILLWIQPPD